MGITTFTILGDSIPKGIITKNNKICLAKQSAVDIIKEHYNIEINNFSFYGQTLKRIYNKKLINQLLSNMNKDNKNYVIFSIGGNDADYNWSEVSLSPQKNIPPITPIKEFKKILQESIKTLQKNNIKVIITTMLPIDSNRYFNNVISKKGNKDEILKFLRQDLTNINRQHEMYNFALIELAMANNCPILDIRSPFLLNKDYMKYLCEDGIHPNEVGYKKIANNIIKICNKTFFNKKEIALA